MFAVSRCGWLAATATLGAVLSSATPGVATPSSAPSAPRASAHDGVEWGSCPGIPDTELSPDAGCAKVAVPLAPGTPDAGNTTLLVGRREARQPENRLGVLVLAGGQFGSTKAWEALLLADLLPPQIRDQFDVIAMEHRGSELSDPSLRCFHTADEQHRAYTDLLRASDPQTRAEKAMFRQTANTIADACNSNGGALARSMSSVTWAHDVDAVREALGEETINIMGQDDYGYAAQVYANLHTDHLRGIVVDGVVDGLRYSGQGKHRKQALGERTGRIEALEQHFKNILAACEKGGAKQCLLAEEHPDQPTPQDKLDFVLRVAKEKGLISEGTIDIVDDQGNIIGHETFSMSLSYDQLVSQLALTITQSYSTADIVAVDLYLLWKVAHGEPLPTQQVMVRDAAHAQWYRTQLRAVTGVHNTSQAGNAESASAGAGEVSPLVTDYYHETDTSMASRCHDAATPGGVWRTMRAAESASKKWPLFGPGEAWIGAECAAWDDRGAGAVAGFDAATKHPMLFVTTTHSAIHHQEFAKQAADRYPSAGLLVNDSWNRAGIGNSECVRDAVGEYFTSLTLPENMTCDADDDPFTGAPLPEDPAPSLVAGSSLGVDHIETTAKHAARPYLPPR